MNLDNDLYLLADRVARLAPSHRDPDYYFEEKSEIVAKILMLARGVPNFGETPANDNIRGFAPGGYTCLCNECGKRFTGAKHSWRCQGCEGQFLQKGVGL